MRNLMGHGVAERRVTLPCCGGWVKVHHRDKRLLGLLAWRYDCLAYEQVGGGSRRTDYRRLNRHEGGERLGRKPLHHVLEGVSEAILQMLHTETPTREPALSPIRDVGRPLRVHVASYSNNSPLSP